MAWPIGYAVGEKHADHLEAVIDLAKQADELVNAGDPDPEGQRLVDEVIEGEICRVRGEGLPISVSGSVPCPVCKEGALRRIKGREGFFWGCGCYPACKVSFPDKKGKPDTDSRRPIAMVSEEHTCSKCEKGLIWRESARKQGVYWWGCSGFPACNFRAFDENGKPKVEI